VNVFEGKLWGEGLRFAVVVARFNSFVTQQLLDGCQTALRLHGVPPEQIDVAWVPGSFEVPVTAKRFAETGRYDAVVCLGAVIRGETPHFDHIAAQVASGLAQVALETGVPTIFGILTTDTEMQALNRAGMKAGNKGYDAALAAIEMATLFEQVQPDT
jgi:6,7-dimethyl-8-ribityllumazine synthase